MATMSNHTYESVVARVLNGDNGGAESTLPAPQVDAIAECELLRKLVAVLKETGEIQRQRIARLDATVAALTGKARQEV